MEWQSIAGQLAQIGLPALGGLFGGPLGSTIGGLVGKGVAAALGVEPTPQAVSPAIAADPNAAAVKLAQIEAETKGREAEIPERVYQLLSQAYGAANLALGTAIAFWLGSSRSSQVKDTQITALLPAATRR